jgi:excisionase family DNA binding protein
MSTKSRIQVLLSKRYLTPAEAAEFYNCSRKTVYKMIDEGVLPAFPLRDGVKSAKRIPTAALERYAVQQAQKMAESRGFSLTIARDCPGFVAPD